MPNSQLQKQFAVRNPLGWAVSLWPSSHMPDARRWNYAPGPPVQTVPDNQTLSPSEPTHTDMNVASRRKHPAADNALLYWQHIVQNHSYPRAKVQLAELYAAKRQPDFARAELKDVLSDDPHAPGYQRKRDRVWIRRAKSLMGKL